MWQRFKTLFQSVDIYKLEKGGDIVTDGDRFIAISGIIGNQYVILVFDAQTLEWIHLLNIENHLVLSPATAQYVQGTEMRIQKIRMKFSQKFLVATVIHSYFYKVSILYQSVF